jgi:type I restriction enzyme S subunit
LSGGFAFKSGDYAPEGRFILRTLNVKDDGSIHRDDAVFLPLDKCGLYKRFELQEQDTLFVMVGATLGKVGYVRRETLPALLNQNMWRIRGRDGLCDKRYLQYAFRYTVAKNLGWASGSARDFVRREDYRTMEIPVPSLAEQKTIAAVLGALDDKIELNRRMNATLDAMVRTMFQSWFVDFDPVRAKLDGKGPVGLDPATAALFPSSFQDSPLGLIPNGWDVATIGAKLSTVLGGTPSRARPEYWTDGTVAWINSGKTNEFRIIEPSEWITEEALRSSATKLLPPRTTVLAITGATLGQVSITEISCCANQSVVAILASEEIPTEFIYPWIEENIEKLIASQTGGAQQHINKGNVEELPLLCPNHRVVAAYRTKAKPLFDQIAAISFQSRTLATLRDTLLPKLLSGELSVPTMAPTL